MTQYSTFYLGDRWFGLPILRVREIIRACEMTPVPLAPRHVTGLINLRGQIVTILDLGARLGVTALQDAREAHVVVLSAPTRDRAEDQGGAEDTAGFLADAIGDVVDADLARVTPAPANLIDTDDAFIEGVLKTDEGLLVLLNLEPILSARA